MLASTLKLVIAQRLVRKACTVCDMQGCSICRFSGYNGRSIISEAYEVDEGLKKLILNKAPQSVLSAYVIRRGFRSLSEDGAEKVEWGVTTHEEVLRVLSE